MHGRLSRSGAIVGAIVLVACGGDTSGPIVQGPESVSIASDCTIPAVPDASTIRLSLDVPVYSPQGQTQLLDYVAPLDTKLHPLVVFVHGGGWRDGTQNEFLPEMAQLATLGYASASVSYRFAPTFIFPAQIEDVRCAIRFLRANSSSLGFDTQRVALIGASAGGHLAGLVAFGPELSQFDGSCPYTTQSLAVNGLVTYYAPLDLQQLQDFPPSSLAGIVDLFGGTPTAAQAAAASPITYANLGDPPVLMTQGTADDLIPPANAVRVRSALGVIGIPSTLVALQGVGHSFPILGTDPSTRSASCTTLAFLQKYLQPQL